MIREDFLDTAEFAYNNRVHAAKEVTDFFADECRHPVTQILREKHGEKTT